MNAILNNSDDAKNYICCKTSAVKNIEELNESIQYYEGMVESAITEESKDFWDSELVKLIEWKESDAFENGEYPQGIDSLIFNLIEWRSNIYAFQNLEKDNSPFNSSLFYEQWMRCSIYAIFVTIGKLLSHDRRDNSLKNIWKDTLDFISEEGIFSEDELNYINNEFSNGIFSRNSNIMKYRNKAIAHNEESPPVTWDEVDRAILILSRMWSILTIWSSLGVLFPIRESSIAFTGIESMFSNNEILKLKKLRDEYIKKYDTWCKSSAHNGAVEEGRSPFFNIKITTKATF